MCESKCVRVTTTTDQFYSRRIFFFYNLNWWWTSIPGNPRLWNLNKKRTQVIVLELLYPFHTHAHPILFFFYFILNSRKYSCCHRLCSFYRWFARNHQTKFDICNKRLYRWFNNFCHRKKWKQNHKTDSKNII